MKMIAERLPTTLSRCLLAATLVLALPMLAVAQHHDAHGSEHHAHDTTDQPAAASSAAGHHAMHGMKPAATTDHAHRHHVPAEPAPTMVHDGGEAKAPAMDHAGMHGAPTAAPHAHAAPSASAPMPHAHGAATARGTRSPDYSDGIGDSDMPGTHMIDNRPLGMLRVDQLEAVHGRDADGQAWEVQGWYGNDIDKLRLSSEGERREGRVEDAEVELLWSHAVAPFWDTQLGLREDLGDGPSRHWAAFGIQGLAPYWVELEATAYVGPSGRTAARVRVEYELLFTQRLILQPELELNLYGRHDPATHTGQGLSDAKLGLRLRYEIRREFAPYVGVVWVHRFGSSAYYARQAGERATDRQFVAGVRFWF